MKNIVAYTPDGVNPPYLSVNRLDDRRVRVTVRSPAKDTADAIIYGTTSEIEIPSDVWAGLLAKAVERNHTLEINDWCRDIHQRNVEAGWWTDLGSGESTLQSRNRAELMMLVISELSEAEQGMSENIKDDKLPHLPMFNVEIADVAIRLFDLIGSEMARFGDTVDVDFDWEIALAKLPIREKGWYVAIANRMSAAMEHLRKQRFPQYRAELYLAQAATFATAEEHGFDLLSVIQEKLDFNANREDHKLSSRLAPDGKKF